jgi:hypothetical protein
MFPTYLYHDDTAVITISHLQLIALFKTASRVGKVSPGVSLHLS